MQVQIVHGPKLESVPRNKRERKRPGTWFYGARIRADMATEIDNLARAAGVKTADIIRSALVSFLAIAKQDSGTQLPHNDQPVAKTIAAPRFATRYTGSGGSDQNALRGIPDRQAIAQAGGRLVDKATVR